MLERLKNVKPAIRVARWYHTGTNYLLSKKDPWKIIESMIDYRIVSTEYLAGANKLEEA